ncbi:MAG TPA: site-specific DNA-methyltransferase [Acidimicrobiales bacterium]|nr:site-specific DNA-methyltransferase [Acidimicrobiales bacterium]
MSRSAWDGIQRNVILIGDARLRLAELPGGSVDCVVTSPPYFNLRDYGTQGQIGLEANVDEWVDELRLVMRGIARVLKPSGSVWLNLGDTYSRRDRHGAPPKSLVLGPERLALALIADGWTIRNKTVWAKTNSMPSPVKDRLACSWEVVYLLVRSRWYFFDLDAIRIPHRSRGQARRPAKATQRHSLPNRPAWAGPLAGNNSGLARMKARGLVGHPLGKNPGDVWSVAPSSFRGSHHATFPPDLVERPLLSTCPERVCTLCGVPWRRRSAATGGDSSGELLSSCRCHAGSRPGLVLDPFFGAGTVGLVAERLGRDWVGIELNPAFAAVAEERISAARITEAKAA